ncbi:hypothetical protein IC232_19010 [Microvirga sp. BT688]|uniref:hypothetical protein n=1 Tax=Microvirga sp. TaxID=1873136 RepID=UPI001684F6F7|nr:hypothetical protein [Microvirga sp.]MBD2748786.1 hypothetical protein [Microvirga sp.]
MNLDDPFPLELVSSRVRTAVLREFQGRCPSIREMMRISDKHWLATPGIGETALGDIRGVVDERSFSEESSSSTAMSDAELLKRLVGIQNEIEQIRTMLKGRIFGASEDVIGRSRPAV